MTEDEEMAELKEIYDELWRNAKTLVKDMRRSISMYLFSGFLTLALTFLYVLYSIIGISSLLAGSHDFLTYATAISGVIGTVLFIAAGLGFLRIFLTLKRRYAKFLEMEHKIEA